MIWYVINNMFRDMHEKNGVTVDNIERVISVTIGQMYRCNYGSQWWYISDEVPVLVASHPREVGGSPVLDQSLLYLVSPPGSVSEPIPSRISPSLRTDDVTGPPSGMAPMDQYLPRDSSLLLGESTDFPFLPAHLTPRQIGEKMVSGSAVGSPTGEPVVAASLSMPDLSREAPFDVHQDASRSGPLHGCWTVCGAVNTA